MLSRLAGLYPTFPRPQNMSDLSKLVGGGFPAFKKNLGGVRWSLRGIRPTALAIMTKEGENLEPSNKY